MAVNQALHDIDRVLLENGSSCAAIELPPPQGELSDNQAPPLEPAPTFDDLIDEQHHLADSVLHSISPTAAGDESVPKLHYVDAPGGSGKTYVFNKLSSHLRHHVQHGLV